MISSRWRFPDVRNRPGKGGLTGIADATVKGGTSLETRRDNPELVAFVRELVMRQDPESYAQTCEMILSLKAAEIETLRCPALVAESCDSSKHILRGRSLEAMLADQKITQIG